MPPEPASHSLHPARPGIVGGGCKAEIAELVAQFAEKLGGFRQGFLTGSKGSSSRLSLAVPGMNCAMPCARWPLRVAGPTASD